MLFNSLQFLIFFPVVTIVYFFIPHRFRWLLLLIASCIFYMAFIPAYILILLFTIIIDYIAGLLIEGAAGRRRKFFLFISIIANVGILVFFKYYGFIGANLEVLASWLHWNYSLPALSIILPIGLSFHTFQAMSYTIEVYRGNQAVERHFGIYALYVLFYPQLVAGPIERPQNLLPQFRMEHVFDYVRVISGLRLMLWGLFKKVVIADRAAVVVDLVFNNVHNFTGFHFIIATVLFAFQIYCDFSGYSDIAIGAARVMGFKLMTNFNRPYIAESVADFWRRWHISLSTWFRDYVYIPLGGNRQGLLRQSFNLLVIFLLSGLWHGASWTFVVWGGLHGIYIALGLWTKNIRDRTVRVLGLVRFPFWYRQYKRAITFTLVCFSWIFFRANSLSDALYIIIHLFDNFSFLKNASYIYHNILTESSLGLRKYELAVLCLSIIGMGVVQLLRERYEFVNFSRLVQWGLSYVLILWILFCGYFTSSSFIYFQF